MKHLRLPISLLTAWALIATSVSAAPVRGMVPRRPGGRFIGAAIWSSR